MDLIMQMNEHRDDEMEELVSQLAREVSEITISSPIQAGPLLIERGLEAVEPGGRMNAEQTMGAEHCQSRMDLRPALIRGRGLAARCAKARSQKGVGKRCQNISEYCGFESGLRRKRTLPGRISLERFMKEEAERIKAVELIHEFLGTKFSTKVLETDYVIDNLDECLQKIELIRRVKDLESRVSSEAFDPVQQKLEAVEEYANVVERALLERQLETVELDGVEENAWRRLAYLSDSVWRYYLGVKRYRQIRKNNEAPLGAHQQRVQRTRVEEKLSMLEKELHLSGYIKKNVRSIDALISVKVGDEIRPDKTDVQGKKEHKWVKERIFVIYEELKSRLGKELWGGAEAFISLEELVKKYVFTNRRPFEDRRDAEEKEAIALTALKEALSKLLRDPKNICSKYAAILLGLLKEESNGYLEVPLDGVHVYREDTDITCAKQQCEYKACKDMPLFTHRPNIKDIAQGKLSDCYLLAGLISVVDQNPEEIMNIMRDNGDGTVTVCFKLEERGENGGMVFTPCYVTVRKTIPVLRQGGRDAFSRGALWVKMMEKAYVASGIHLLRKINENRMRNEQAPQKYSDFLIWIRDGEKRVDYDEIERGGPGQFISLLLGKETESYFLTTDRNQQGESAAEDENTGQIQGSYYTQEQKILFETIEQALQSGAYVAFGTREFPGAETGPNGETESGGLVGNHAYALMNTQRIEIDGVEHCYVLVMNPWAHKGLVYRADEQYRVYAVDNEREEGIFLMDIKTFAEVVSCWETVSA